MPPPARVFRAAWGKFVTALRVSAENLVGSPMERQLAGIIADHLRMTTGRSTSESEKKSWRRSLPVLARDLVEAGPGQGGRVVGEPPPPPHHRGGVGVARVGAAAGGGGGRVWG